MRAAIITNGELGEVKKLKHMLPTFDLIICCDGAIRHLEDLELVPDLIIGDFDSVDLDLLDTYKKSDVDIRSFPARKDETDTELAADAAIEAGADQVILLGALGGRWDHAYANIMVLVKLVRHGIEAMILHSHNQIMVSNQALYLNGRHGSFVSLLPLGDDVVIQETRGLKYKIKEQKMPLGTTYGISNIFIDNTAEIRIASGWLMAIIAED